MSESFSALQPLGFVRTREFHTLRNVVLRRRQHVLLIGAAGQGKTTLLHHLDAQLKTEGHFSIYLPLRNLPKPYEAASETARLLLDQAQFRFRGEEQNSELLQQLGRRRDLSYRRDRGASLRRLFRLISKATGPSTSIVILADGLDELSDPSEIASWLEELTVLVPRITVVVSSRRSVFAEMFRRRIQFHVLVLDGLTRGESLRLLQSRFGAHSDSIDFSSVLNYANGNPADLFLAALYIQRYGKSPSTTISAQGIIDSVFADILSSTSIRQRQVLSAAFCIIALFRPVSVSFLARVIGLHEAQIGAIVRDAEILVIEADTVDFVHPLLCQHVLQRFVVPADVAVADLEFGKEAAENDTQLEDRFIPRPDIEKILEGKKTIVLGDRGAGKSAIYQRLQLPLQKLSSESYRVQEEDFPLIVTSRLAGEFLPQFNADSLEISSAERFKALWMLYAASLAASRIQTLLHIHPCASAKYVRLLRQLLRSSGRSADITGENIPERIWVAIRSAFSAKITFSVGPVSVEPNWSRENSRGGQHLSVVDFIDQTDQVLTAANHRMLIVIDQIDEIRKYERKDQEALIQGLFLAESFFAQRRSIRIVALLRTDLFEIYDIQEKNKFVSRTTRLAWTRPELLDLLIDRLFSNPILESTTKFIFSELTDSEARRAVALRIGFPEEVEGLPFVEWLWVNLQNGNNHISARQIILFLNLARDKEAPQERRTVPLFGSSSVIEAMAALSELSYKEVVSDFRVATEFVQNCRAGKIRDFELSAVQHLFAATDGPVAKQIEQLERLGFLERKVVQQGSDTVGRFHIPVLYSRSWDQTTR